MRKRKIILFLLATFVITIILQACGFIENISITFAKSGYELEVGESIKISYEYEGTKTLEIWAEATDVIEYNETTKMIIAVGAGEAYLYFRAGSI